LTGSNIAIELPLLGTSLRLVYEDLLTLNKSAKYSAGVVQGTRVANAKNARTGIKARRGDGTFGELVPHEIPIAIAGFDVRRGPVATIEVGAEVKILAKAMIKQIDRVMTDLKNQLSEFKKRSGNPISFAIVGINSAPYTVGYEGNAVWRTDGKKHKHPIAEAAEAELRLMSEVHPLFDEFLILRYSATNDPPYPFQWVDLAKTTQNYGAALTRISREYDRRF
jgi:hypothetical protein